MVFWIGILVGGLFVWLALKRGFLVTWTALFNTVVSVYIAIFSTPYIVEAVPAAAQTSCGYCFTMAATGIGVFLILGGISYAFLTGRFKVAFPKILDYVGAGVFGFLTGMLVWSFLILVVSAAPISESTLARETGISGETQQAHAQYICWWCDMLNAIVGHGDDGSSTEQIIARIAQNVRNMKQAGNADPNDPNAPQGAIKTHENRQGIGQEPDGQELP